MKSNTVIWIVGVVIVVGGAAYWMINSRSAMGNDSGYMEGATTQSTTADAAVAGATETSDSGAAVGASVSVGATSYTAANVATHADMSSCWSIIDGNVYDLTSWISQHPGGERAILSLCGVDGTTAFHSQHGDKKKQADLLATMKIGVLTQ